MSKSVKRVTLIDLVLKTNPAVSFASKLRIANEGGNTSLQKVNIWLNNLP